MLASYCDSRAAISRLIAKDGVTFTLERSSGDWGTSGAIDSLHGQKIFETLLAGGGRFGVVANAVCKVVHFMHELVRQLAGTRQVHRSMNGVSPELQSVVIERRLDPQIAFGAVDTQVRAALFAIG